MKTGGGETSTIVVVSALFAVSITAIFVFGYFSGGADGFRPLISGSDEAEFRIPVVELVTATARTRGDEGRAHVLSSEFSSKSKPIVRVSDSGLIDFGFKFEFELEILFCD